MIYHELWGQHLRLGNFLFKYAWSIAKGEQFGEVTTYPKNYYLWQYLKYPPYFAEEPKPNSEFIKVNWEWSIEEELRINNLIKNKRDKLVSLDSFFQSEKWFENYTQKVFNALRFTDEASDRVYNKLNTIHLFDKPTIGIGVRLGDFIGHGDFYQIPHDWYISALDNHFSNWRTDYNVIVFSDDIEKCKIVFKDYPFNYAEPNNTHTHADNFKHYHGDASDQLISATWIDNFIIGNSTFSWWQAWLCKNFSTGKLGKIIHCGKVFSDTGRMKDIDTSNYYPKNWIKYDQ